jgi:hypothetical protein
MALIGAAALIERFSSREGKRLFGREAPRRQSTVTPLALIGIAHFAISLLIASRSRWTTGASEPAENPA